jgi:hypothetical protein
MRRLSIPAVFVLALLAGCAGQSSVKPVESLDERTGVTVGALKQPIELVPSAQFAAQNSRQRLIFAYLGPVEWNQSGTLSYGLWIHIAPGNGVQPRDIRTPGALTLILDDGSLALSPVETPPLGRDPYQPVASWGQTGYYNLSVDALRRMAASQKLELDVRAADGSVIGFAPTLDTHAALTEYLRDRGITAD